jgi:DNA helicase-2/ATP-dependent DNA helicase PcrA
VESIAFVRKNLFKFDLVYFRPLGNPTKFIDGMLNHFSRLQDEDITPDQYLKWVKAKTEKQKSKISGDEEIELQKWMELANAYSTYDELKAKEGLMDFGDLITKTLELFRRRKNVLRNFQKQFKYVLVDEFQDTNISQYELLKLLLPPSSKGNLTVVGDDLQSIYKFRGAAVSNILYFKKDYKKAKMIVLTTNYRSTQIILDASYKLSRFNAPDTLEDKMGICKNLKSVKKGRGEEVVLIHKDRVENEADTVANTIGELINEGKLSCRDIAILVRANNHSEPFMRALSRHGIPYQFLGPGRLFRQPEIVDLIAYLKVLYDFEDSVSMYRLLSIGFLNISLRDLISLTNYAKRKNYSLFEASEKNSDAFMSEDSREKINKVLDIILRQQKLVMKETAGQLLYNFLEETGLIQKLLNPDTPDAEKRAKNISKFFDKLKSYEVEHEDATITAVVDWIDLASELGESPLAADTDWTDVNAVNILTIHSAKGLEFPIVFLVNLVSQRFPTMERHEQIPIPDELIKEVLPEGDYHLEEERRLCYVGMTRAKERLYLTAADYYGEGKREKKLSPFIFEALGENIAKSERVSDDTKQLSFLDYEPKNKLSDVETRQKIHVDYLSYSQIETFKICPLHYKLRYIYKLPTPATSSQSFGNTFHLTMKSFYEKVGRGEKVSVEMINDTLKENWINEGYMSKSHEKGSFEKAKKFLKYFLDNFYNSKIQPVALEQSFNVRIGSLMVGGKIDRVDEVNGGLEIIDYKTGANPLTQKEADNDLQLSIYALAATEIPYPPFNKKSDKVKLTLMYFDTPRTVSTVRTKEDLDEAKKLILDYKKQIEESDFRCSGNMLCETCEYKLFCRSDENENR